MSCHDRCPLMHEALGTPSPLPGVKGSIYRALGLMVAASPCALAVSPLAYATAVSACASKVPPHPPTATPQNPKKPETPKPQKPKTPKNKKIKSPKDPPKAGSPRPSHPLPLLPRAGHSFEGGSSPGRPICVRHGRFRQDGNVDHGRAGVPSHRAAARPRPPSATQTR